jgi:hypothetical protein
MSGLLQWLFCTLTANIFRFFRAIQPAVQSSYYSSCPCMMWPRISVLCIPTVGIPRSGRTLSGSRGSVPHGPRTRRRPILLHANISSVLASSRSEGALRQTWQFSKSCRPASPVGLGWAVTSISLGACAGKISQTRDCFFVTRYEDNGYFYDLV